MLYDRIALEKHSTSQQELRDFKIRSIGFSRQTRKDLNQRPDFAQAKRECKRSHDEHQQDYRTIPRSQKSKTAKRTSIRRHQRTRLRGSPSKKAGGSTKSRRETFRQLRQDRGPTCQQLRHRRQIGTKRTGRRTIGILSILQALTIGEFFSELGQFRLPGEKPPANRRGV